MGRPLGIFVDTSGLYPLLDRRSPKHEQLLRTWDLLAYQSTHLVTTNYVVTETLTLCQARLGMESVRELVQDVLPLIGVEWVNERQHSAAVQQMLAANRRNLSLVDCVSFAAMCRLGIRGVFTLDAHFAEQGFECLPAQR